MARVLYWLSDADWAAIQPRLSVEWHRARREDDRRVISGIGHRLKTGSRCSDGPVACGPHTTVYNRFNR